MDLSEPVWPNGKVLGRWSQMSYSNTSDLGNQENKGPHQDHIFDNPSALCLALWAKY